MSFHRVLLVVVLAALALVSVCAAQTSVLTGRVDNARTGTNTNETLLTPGNVNSNNFGHLFSQPVDYQVLGQPLYVPNVNIPGLGTHNVVYVVTMLDSVYAFDADDNSGPNASPLWSVNFTDPANGITVASYATKTLPCTNANSTGPGFNQEGIVSTPVIDPVSSTMYVVAKTVDNGTVHHRLHALDLATGQEKFGGPVIITATSVSNAGTVRTFNSLHQKNRPGLLLLNGVVYMGFGSNYCNDSNTGWVLGYDATTLQQLGVFNTNPDHGLTSIWQSGQGLAADDAGNIYAETGEGKFDIDVGGQGYANSVLKLSTGPLALADFFTPFNVLYLNVNDLDLSSSGPLVLPDQDGPHPHELIASGKQGTIYLMDRDNMGQYNSQTDMIVQELPFAVGEMFSSPSYWNGLVYFYSNAHPLQVFAMSGGLLSSVPVAVTSNKMTGAHSPSISANGDANGIVWLISGGQLWAFDATSMNLLYNTKQNAIRDSLPTLAHFATQTIANGRVYVATRNSLEVYGLYHLLNVTAGANQSAQVNTTLGSPIQIQAVHAYTGTPISGVTVSFSDGGKGGTFNPSSAITDSNGNVSTTYTFPSKSGTYIITASASGFGNVTASETALPAGPARLSISSGNKQTGAAGSTLPQPLVARVLDAYGNGVPSITVNFAAAKGIVAPTSAITDASGKASANYQLPTAPGTYTVAVSSPNLKITKFTETGVAGPPASITIVSGNNQTAAAGTALSQPLVVQVTDQYGNPDSGIAVTFSANSGTVTGSPASTDLNGMASVTYTAGTTAGTASITAAYNALSVQFSENITAGPAAVVMLVSGNNQTAPAGTALPAPLTVAVTDQYGNLVPGVSVTFSDGGAGGQFSDANPVVTDNTGRASQGYTLPAAPGSISISATAAGVATPAIFSETGQ